MPTLDDKPIRDLGYLDFESRKEAWEEAIRWVRHRAGLAIRVRLGSQEGCVPTPGEAIVVERVAEARRAILRHAKSALREHGRDPEDRRYLRLKGGKKGPTWKDLAQCEINRHYDPDNPESGMTCSYLLYEQGDLGVVGGGVWTFAVSIWATAPPEAWDHPADQPCGLDTGDD